MASTIYRLGNEFGTDFLEQFIEWIRTKMDPDDVFTKEQLSEWADRNEFFHMDDLYSVAGANGYIHPDDMPETED